MHEETLQDQIDYYRARASEYEEWWLRQGRYDRGEDFRAVWAAEAERLRAALHSMGPVAHTLEFAPGTGIWTRELATFSQQVTAIDASPEMIAVNQSQLNADNVAFEVADIFSWKPTRTYDLVFFGFWITHVPRERLDGFLRTVRAALAEDGRVFFVDGRPDPGVSARDHATPDADGVYQKRLLNDGREFRIIKIYYQPDELTAAFARAGIDAAIQLTDRFFIYGSGTVKR